MPDRINASMDAMQPSHIDTSSHSTLADPQLVELPDRDCTMLPLCDLRNQNIRIGDFPSYIGG
jgi:hypothetical protein